MIVSKTAIVLEEYLRYEPDTGLIFFNKPVKGRKRPLDQPIGTLSYQGYLQTNIKGVQHKVHRLAWFLHYGVWPVEQIDHINGDKSDNRIINLRCGNSVNQHNRKMPLGRSNKTGAHCVKGSSKFTSSIKVGGIQKHLGYFNCPTAAHFAYLLEKQKVLNV